MRLRGMDMFLFPVSIIRSIEEEEGGGKVVVDSRRSLGGNIPNRPW